ncbi:cyclin-U4-1 [Malania oleifera]|uniref:cyclin-U4-1 n=1 Tax=Malania oleifera TaxID=397392 RepID=UPI0025AE6C9E|nr:cyclin-U4-1 [Malania oleifera]XP_057960496.1 cyclin-U4-1 [Malania oleifera]XP_057960497.1 cyclin-U4-1 [Malania oleifera]
MSTLGLDESGLAVSGAPQVLALLSLVLEQTTQKNEKLLAASEKRDIVTVFHGSSAPALSIRQYMDRIFKYSSCSPSCFVAAYIYLDEFLRRTGVCLTSLNVHRFLITSVMVAAKFMDDECYNNAYYAKVGGVSTEEMNRLEMEFLFGLDFKLFVGLDTFDVYCSWLEEEATTNPRIQRPTHFCGLKETCPKKDESKCPPTVTGYGTH